MRDIDIYKIKPQGGKKEVLHINPKTAENLGLKSAKITVLQFGSARQFASISVAENVPPNEICLSSKLIASLRLPLYPDYELRASRNRLEIGPFIGMLISREDKNLTPNALEKMKIYVSDYARLHGAIVVFALDAVDPVGQLIEGYCYNPLSRKFEKGVFPFPSAIYRTIGLSDRWKNLFLSVIGGRLYNSHYFNKWEMYQWYSKNPGLSAHVPFTCKYKSPEDVFNMLYKYQKAYIKPISGLGGHGVVQVRLHNGRYIFKYREHGENRTDISQNKAEAAEYLTIRLNHGKYLVQQPIELIQIDERVIDFRCIMQKNLYGKWECKAIIGRCGNKGSIVSNISSGGSAFMLKNRNSLPLPKRKLFSFTAILVLCIEGLRRH